MASDNINTSILIKQLNQGSLRAFDRIFHLYSKDLIRNIHYQLKDLETAKDLTQEVFLIVWKRRESIDPDKTLKSYINGIAQKLIIDTYRRNATGKKVFHNVANGATELYAAPDEALEYKETLQIINQAINTLSPQQKIIYQKCRMEGQSHEEIAAELGLSKHTVSNHITTANRTVTSYLRQYARAHSYDQTIFLLCLWMLFQN